MSTKYFMTWWMADGSSRMLMKAQPRKIVLARLNAMLRKRRMKPQITDIKITPIYQPTQHRK
jgi:hypothetical protein